MLDLSYKRERDQKTGKQTDGQANKLSTVPLVRMHAEREILHLCRVEWSLTVASVGLFHHGMYCGLWMIYLIVYLQSLLCTPPYLAYGDILFQAKTSASEKVKPEDLYEDDLAVEIEDEYDPAIPNSYEQVVKERRLERDRIREEEVSES